MRSERRTRSISTAMYLVLVIGLIALGIGEEIDGKEERNRISERIRTMETHRI